MREVLTDFLCTPSVHRVYTEWGMDCVSNVTSFVPAKLFVRQVHGLCMRCETGCSWHALFEACAQVHRLCEACAQVPRHSRSYAGIRGKGRGRRKGEMRPGRASGQQHPYCPQSPQSCYTPGACRRWRW